MNILNISEASSEQKAQIESIFWESSSIQSFQSQKAKDEFLYKYLSGYYDHPEYFYYVTKDTEVLGYVCGFHNQYYDHEYYQKADIPLKFKPHLHINMSDKSRGIGLGSKLIQFYALKLKELGHSGVHIITANGDKSINFYQKNGFEILQVFDYKGRKLVTLCSSLA